MALKPVIYACHFGVWKVNQISSPYSELTSPAKDFVRELQIPPSFIFKISARSSWHSTTSSQLCMVPGAAILIVASTVRDRKRN